jgi:PhnB protein
MTFAVTTHLNFQGNARAALDFYGRAFGAEPVLMTYAAMGQAALADAPDHIIWGQIATDDGFRIMAFDVQAGRDYDQGSNAFFVSLRGSAPDEVQARWSALAEEATILQELAPSAWSPLYGMLTDRFGVTWIVDVDPQAAPHS